MKLNKLIILGTFALCICFNSPVVYADSAKYDVTVTDHNGKNKHYKAENYNAKRHVITLTNGSKIQVPTSSTVTYKNTEKKSINHYLNDAMTIVLGLMIACLLLIWVLISIAIWVN